MAGTVQISQNAQVTRVMNYFCAILSIISLFVKSFSSLRLTCSPPSLVFYYNKSRVGFHEFWRMCHKPEHWKQCIFLIMAWVLTNQENDNNSSWRATWTDMPYVSNPFNTGEDTLVKTTSINLIVALEVIVMHYLVTVASEYNFVLISLVDDEMLLSGNWKHKYINTFRMNDKSHGIPPRSSHENSEFSTTADLLIDWHCHPSSAASVAKNKSFVSRWLHWQHWSLLSWQQGQGFPKEWLTFCLDQVGTHT